MSTFNVELKKVVDDSYEIEVGHGLEQKLISDINAGLVGNIKKFAVVTDSTVAINATSSCSLRARRARPVRLRNSSRTPCLKKAIAVIAVLSLSAAEL